MALDMRYPDPPLIEEDAPRPRLVAQRFVPPQLSKIPRRIGSIDLGNPDAGADYNNLTIPTNEVWRVSGFQGTLVAAVAASSRIFRAVIMDGTTIVGGLMQALNATLSGETRNYLGMPGTPIAGSSAGFQPTFIAIAPTLIPGSFVIAFVTENLNIGDDWGNGQIFVERWTLPRGLARGEIPMGLESGFMWDLDAVRKVSED